MIYSIKQAQGNIYKYYDLTIHWYIPYFVLFQVLSTPISLLWVGAWRSYFKSILIQYHVHDLSCMLVVVGTHNGNLSIVFTGKILPKFKKEMILKVFSCQNEKKYKSPDPYNLFYHVAKNIKGWLNICTLFLIYSKIWLNLHRDDHHLFYIFIWMIATLGTNKNF
jgi:hypothetical protein